MSGAELSGLKFRRNAQSVCMFRKKGPRGGGRRRAKKRGKRDDDEEGSYREPKNCKSVWKKEKAGTDNTKLALYITERHNRPRDGPAAQSDSSRS